MSRRSSILPIVFLLLATASTSTSAEPSDTHGPPPLMDGFNRPSVVGEQVYLTAGDWGGDFDFVVALDADSGQARWRLELGEPVPYPPAIIDDIGVVHWGTFIAGFRMTGMAALDWVWQVWDEEIGGPAAPPISVGGVVVASAHVGGQDDAAEKTQLIAVAPGNESVMWRRDGLTGLLGLGHRLLAFAYGPKPGHSTLCLLEARTGDVVWTRELEDAVADGLFFLRGTKHQLKAGPQLLPSGNLLVPTATEPSEGMERVIYCIRADDGSVKWRKPTGRPVSQSQLAISAGSAFLLTTYSNRTVIDIHRLDTNTGKVISTTSASPSAEVDTVLGVYGDVLVVSAQPNWIFGLSVATGKTLWERNLQVHQGLTFGLEGRRAYLGHGWRAYGTGLAATCLDIPTGEILWQYREIVSR